MDNICIWPDIEGACLLIRRHDTLINNQLITNLTTNKLINMYNYGNILFRYIASHPSLEKFILETWVKEEFMS